MNFKKIDLLRFGIGIILFIRVLEIAYAMSVFDNEVSLKVTIILLLIVLFTIGFFTPIMSLSLLISIRWLDSYAHTTTLGTTILVHLLILIFLSNSGQYYSVDSILLKKKNLLSKCLKRQYSIIGLHSQESLSLVYFFHLYHICHNKLSSIRLPYSRRILDQRPYHKSLFGNSYLANGYQEFRWFENSYPNLVSFLSYAGTIGQSIFQFFMIPLIFFSLGNIFCKMVGDYFFLIIPFLY